MTDGYRQLECSAGSSVSVSHKTSFSNKVCCQLQTHQRPLTCSLLTMLAVPGIPWQGLSMHKRLCVSSLQYRFWFDTRVANPMPQVAEQALHSVLHSSQWLGKFADAIPGTICPRKAIHKESNCEAMHKCTQLWVQGKNPSKHSG